MKKSFLLLLSLASLLIIGCAAPSGPAADTPPAGIITPQSSLIHDFGDININGGTVATTFNFTNTDLSPLTIYEVTTSCGCTTGEITVGSKKHGPFGMHSPSQKAIIVPPGSPFAVTIFYDPLFHGPTDLGQRQRTLFFFSSAKADNTIVRRYQGRPNFTEIAIRGNVFSASSL